MCVLDRLGSNCVWFPFHFDAFDAYSYLLQPCLSLVQHVHFSRRVSDLFFSQAILPLLFIISLRVGAVW